LRLLRRAQPHLHKPKRKQLCRRLKHKNSRALTSLMFQRRAARSQTAMANRSRKIGSATISLSISLRPLIFPMRKHLALREKRSTEPPGSLVADLRFLTKRFFAITATGDRKSVV